MNLLPAQALRDLGVELFQACGAPAAEAALVADHLVEASLMGIDSHGVVRYVMYVEHCLDGTIRPGAPARMVDGRGRVAVVDCGMNFGQVGAHYITDLVSKDARVGGIAFAVSRRCQHVGRLGAWPQKLAEAGLFALAVANSHRHGHFVVPWGGREGRLATNPLAWAAPTGGDPLLLDMSTSMVPEGRIRTALHAGERLPEGRILDGDGRPTVDPADFYGPGEGPPAGAILPFGGDLGYRGFGLSLLVEVLGAAIAGEPLAEPDDGRYINGFGILAIDPAALAGSGDRFQDLTGELRDYVRSSAPAPGFEEVLMPGEREFRTMRERRREGIPLAEESCRLIAEAAERVEVRVPW